MFRTLRREWRCLVSSPPGKRFERRYRRSRDRRVREHEGQEKGAPRVIRLVAASVLFAIGLCVILFPMVYIPFFLLSGALFASESLWFARLLDQVELDAWEAWRAFRRKSGLSPLSIKVVAVALGIGCLVLTSCVYLNALNH